MSTRSRTLIDWTQERDTTLRSMWEAGATGTVIAKKLGSGITRSAVMGRVYRLELPMRGLTGRQRLERARAPVVPKLSPKPSQQGKAGLTARRIIERQAALLPPSKPLRPTTAWDALPGTTPVAFMDVPRGCCKWPVGDGLFCAEKAAEGSYCSAHWALAYKPGTARHKA